MVTVAIDTRITARDKQAIYSQLSQPRMQSPAELAARLELPEGMVFEFLTGEAARGNIDSRYGKFSTWE